MPLSDFVAGWGWLVAVYGPVGLATAWLVRRHLRDLPAATAACAAAVVALTLLVAVHLLPLALGVLSRGTVVATAFLILGSIVVAGDRLPARPPGAAEGGAEDGDLRLEGGAASLARAAVATAAALAAGGLVASAARLVDAPLTELDLLTWNLPLVGHWIQGGSVWEVAEWVPYWSHDNYPHHGDLVFLSIVLPWHSDFLLRALAHVLLGVFAIAVFALAREVGGSRATAVASAAVLVALPAVLVTTAFTGMPDVVLMIGVAVGALFLLRYGRGGGRRDLVFAGLGLGLALGTKWYGLTTIAVVLTVWVVSLRFGGMRLGAALRGGGVVAGVAGVAGGFWLLRNWVVYGNPAYPVEVSVLGLQLFDAPRDLIREAYGFALADYTTDADAWRDHIAPAFRDTMAAPGALLAAAGVAAAVRAWRARGAALWLLAAAGGVAVLYWFTPYSALGPEGDPFNVAANTRYVVPALILAAAAAALLAQAPRALQLAFLVMAPVAVAHGLLEADLASLPATAVAAVGIGSIAAVGMRLAPRMSPPSGRVALGGAATLLVAAFLATLVIERRFASTRDELADPVLGWISSNAAAGARIGLAGAWDDQGLAPVFPAFGPRLDNEVSYVGRLVDGQLRPLATRRAWRAEVRRRGLQLLLVGRARSPLYGGTELRWARDERFPVLASSDRFMLFGVSGRQ
jgi:hypothetical protein